MIRDPLAVVLVLAVVVYVSLRLEERFAIARVLGSVLLAIVLGAVLANVGLLPQTSPAYDALGGIVVNLGIALILLGVDVRSVIRAGPGMLAAFALGAVGTVVGVVVGAFVLHDAVGPETWKLAGQYTGTYIGGGVNMVAVGRELGTDPDVFAAAVAADNVTTAVWMAACFALPGLLARFWQQSPVSPAALPAAEPAAPGGGEFTSSLRAFELKDAAALVVLGLGAVWLSGLLSTRVAALPQVLWLTTLVLLLAQLGPVRRLAGGPMLGNYLLQLFLASLGAQSIVAEILRVGPAILYFTLIAVALHALLLFGVGRLVGLDLPTLAVASQANVGGPASAMALATARGYADRLLPGIAVGLLGYAVGNYAGFAVAGVMRQLL